jgi:hypothetical protein
VDELRWQYRQLEKTSIFKGEKRSSRKMIKHVIYNNRHSDFNTTTASSTEEAISWIISVKKDPPLQQSPPSHILTFVGGIGGDWSRCWLWEGEEVSNCGRWSSRDTWNGWGLELQIFNFVVKSDNGIGHLKLDLEANSKANVTIQTMDLALGPPIPNPRPGPGPNSSIQVHPNITDAKLGIAICCRNLVLKIGI